MLNKDRGAYTRFRRAKKFGNFLPKVVVLMLRGFLRSYVYIRLFSCTKWRKSPHDSTKKYPLQDWVAIAQFYPSPNRENKGIDLYTQSLKKRKFEEKNVNRH